MNNTFIYCHIALRRIGGYMDESFSKLKRMQVDKSLKKWRDSDLPKRPNIGWIKAIRQALDMPASYLANRLGLVPSTVSRLEESETYDAITLSSLRKIAEVLNCELQYCLVPKKSIDEIKRDQANKIIRQRMNYVAHSMTLESQKTSKQSIEMQIDDAVNELLSGRRKGLWRLK